MRDSIIFYRSFYEAIKELPEKNQIEVLTAIFELGFNFNIIELSGLSKTIFTLIKPQIEANNNKYINGLKGAKYGKMGGRGNKKKPQENPKKTPNVNENENDNENVNEKRNKFIPPKLDEIIKYFIDNGYTKESAIKAFNYYDIANWYDSKGKKVKIWKQKMQAVWFREENKIPQAKFVQ